MKVAQSEFKCLQSRQHRFWAAWRSVSKSVSKLLGFEVNEQTLSSLDYL